MIKEFLMRTFTLGKVDIPFWAFALIALVLFVLFIVFVSLAIKNGSEAKRSEKRVAADAEAKAIKRKAVLQEEEIINNNSDKDSKYIRVSGRNEGVDPYVREPEIPAEATAEEPVKEEVKEVPVVVEEKEQEEEKPAGIAAEAPQEPVEEETAAVDEKKKQKKAAPTRKPAQKKPAQKKAAPKKSTAKPAEETKTAAKSTAKPEAKKAPEKVTDKAPEKVIKKAPEKDNKIGGKIEITNSEIGGYLYILKANNGQLLYESKAYRSKASCMEAVNNFIEAVKAGMFSTRSDKFNNYKFILKSHTSNNLIYVGESFSTESSCKKNIESVKRFAVASDIVDNSEDNFIANVIPYEISKEVKDIVKSGKGTTGKWEIVKSDENDKNSPYEYLLYANNGQLLYESRDYKTLASCNSGLLTFINTIKTGVFLIDPDKSGRFKFVLKSKSANSAMEYYGEHYDTKKACAGNIESVYRFALMTPAPGLKK